MIPNQFTNTKIDFCKNETKNEQKKAELNGKCTYAHTTYLVVHLQNSKDQTSECSLVTLNGAFQDYSVPPHQEINSRNAWH